MTESTFPLFSGDFIELVDCIWLGSSVGITFIHHWCHKSEWLATVMEQQLPFFTMIYMTCLIFFLCTIYFILHNTKDLKESSRNLGFTFLWSSYWSILSLYADKICVLGRHEQKMMGQFCTCLLPGLWRRFGSCSSTYLTFIWQHFRF